MNAAARSRLLLALHRRLGITSAIFVIILSITGIVLQHGATLGIDGWFVSSGFARDWYGMEAPETRLHFSIGGQGISYIGDALYFGQDRLPGRFTELRGGVAFDQGLAIATASSILLLTPNGDVIETLTAEIGLPQAIRRIGTTRDGSIFLQTASGIQQADLDAAVFTTTEQSVATINWSAPSDIDRALGEAIREDYAGTLINWERLVLDIHSGRMLGTAGVVLVDLMAVLFVLLAATGVWSWSRRRAR